MWHLLGAVILLLWGTHMVASGIQRGFGAALRRTLAAAARTPWRAAALGAGITVLLQSSTATGLMAATFSADGTLPLAAGLIVMLGANVGTAVAAKMLTFPLGDAAALLLAAGYIAFRKAATDRWRQAGRAGLGLGMMLTALAWLSASLGGQTQTGLVGLVIHGLAHDPTAAAVTGLLVAWAAHSSIASILALTALQGAHPWPVASMVMAVLGINIGAALPPWLEASSARARRLPLGNLTVRAGGAALVLASYPLWAAWGHAHVWAASATPTLHLALNLVWATLAWGLTPRLAALMVRLYPDPPPADDPGLPRHLDHVVSQEAHLAIVAATRETLRILDEVQAIAMAAMAAALGTPSTSARRPAVIAKDVSRLVRATQAYMSAIPVANMGEDDARHIDHLSRWLSDLDQAADAAARLATSVKAQAARDDTPLLQRRRDDLAHAFMQAARVLTTDDLEAARTSRALKSTWLEQETEWRQSRGHDAPSARDTTARVLRETRRILGHLTGLAWLQLDYEARTHAIGAPSDVLTDDGNPNGEDATQESTPFAP